MLKHIKNNIKLVADRSFQAEKEGKKFMNLAYEIRDKKIGYLTSLQIKSILSDFFENFRRFIPFLMMPIAVESYLEKELDKYLDKKYQGDKDKIQQAKFLILTSPRQNLQEEEQISILKLAEEFSKTKKVNDSLRQKIKKHLDKFAVLGLRYGVGNIWQEQDILDRIRPLNNNGPRKQYLQLMKTRKENEQKLNQLIDNLKPNQRIREIIRMIREYIYLRTYRTNILNNSLGIIKPFLEGVAKRLNTDWNTMNYMILPEVMESLDKKFVPDEFLKEVKKRKNGFATIFIDNKFYIFTGKDIDRLAEFFNLKEKVDRNTRMIKGVIANAGKIKGIVKILFTPDDNQKVQPGDILVTSMTTPNFVPAMEKAAAFITDEGGILCHAAIVSREMNKPCIIGTKVVTQVLKDGDMVEVDADKGIVKKLNK